MASETIRIERKEINYFPQTPLGKKMAQAYADSLRICNCFLSMEEGTQTIVVTGKLEFEITGDGKEVL